MPRVCYERPNRSQPRRYSAKDAGRIICYARKYGATYGEIIAESRRRGCVGLEACDCEEVKNFVQTVLELAAGAVLAILVPESLLGRIAFPVLRQIARLLPGGSVARLVAAIDSLGQSKLLLAEIEAETRKLLARLAP